MINLVSQFKNILDDDSVYRFINDMAEESKNCSEIVEKEFKKNLVISNKDNKNFEKAI